MLWPCRCWSGAFASGWRRAGQSLWLGELLLGPVNAAWVLHRMQDATPNCGIYSIRLIDINAWRLAVLSCPAAVQLPHVVASLRCFQHACGNGLVGLRATWVLVHDGSVPHMMGLA